MIEATIGGQPFLLERRVHVCEANDVVTSVRYEVFFGSKLGPLVWEADLPYGAMPERMIELMQHDGGERACMAFLTNARKLGPSVLGDEIVRQAALKGRMEAQILADFDRQLAAFPTDPAHRGETP